MKTKRPRDHFVCALTLSIPEKNIALTHQLSSSFRHFLCSARAVDYVVVGRINFVRILGHQTSHSKSRNPVQDYTRHITQHGSSNPPPHFPAPKIHTHSIYTKTNASLAISHPKHHNSTHPRYIKTHVMINYIIAYLYLLSSVLLLRQNPTNALSCSFSFLYHNRMLLFVDCPISRITHTR